MLDTWTSACGFALRRLRHDAPTSVVAVAALAAGIAGTTLMFALVQGVLRRPLPVQDQDRLILVWKERASDRSAHLPFGDRAIDAVADGATLLAGTAGVTRNGAGRTAYVDGGDATWANVAEVTGGFFEVLGVRPLLGRTLARADDHAGAGNPVVISAGFWQRRYGGTPSVMGRLVTLDGRAATIVGVMPADLDYPIGVEVWRTTAAVPVDGPFGDAARSEVNLVARLRPGVSRSQAGSEIAAIDRRWQAANAAPASDLVPVVRPFEDAIVGDVRTPLVALFAAVAMVLLIACANVANLLVMRAESRRVELALRAAIGADRRRLVWDTLAESLLLSTMAGVVGLGLARLFLEPLLRVAPEGLPRTGAVRIDLTIVVFAGAVAFVTAVLAGLGPALLSTRGDLASALRSGAAGIAHAPASTRGRRLLVAAQAALAVVVVTGAVLLIRTVLGLQAVDPGFPVERLALVELYVPEGQLATRTRHAQFLDEMVQRLQAIPDVAAVTPVNLAPFSGQGWDVPRFTAERQDDRTAVGNPSLNLESVHANYFETLQVPLMRGRAFSTSDREGSAPVAIVSQALADRIWPDVDPVGQRLKAGPPDSDGPWYTVIGVARETRYRELRQPNPTLYLPAAQFQMTATLLVIRTGLPLDRLASRVHDETRRISRDVQVMRVAAFDAFLARPLARPRFAAFLLGLFGALALVLSGIGLYAVLSAAVRRRSRELAIRLAVGATPARIRWLVAGDILGLAGLGGLAGGLGSLMAAPVLGSLLYGVESFDATALLGAVALLLVTCGLAGYLPARRAGRVDVVRLLRE